MPPEAFNYAQRVRRAGRRNRPGFAVTYCKRGPHDLYHFNEPYRMLRGETQPPVLALRNEKIITRHVTAVALSLFFREFKDRFSKVKGLFGDLASPCAVADFARFLRTNRARVEQAIRGILPPDLPAEIAAQLGVADGTWIETISGEESAFAVAEAEVVSDYRAVIDLKEKAKKSDDFDTGKWAQSRARTIEEEYALSFLSRKAVIPKYGFPVDVVELDTQHTNEASDVSLQRDLGIAISEFAHKQVGSEQEGVDLARPQESGRQRVASEGLRSLSDAQCVPPVEYWGASARHALRVPAEAAHVYHSQVWIRDRHGQAERAEGAPAESVFHTPLLRASNRR